MKRPELRIKNTPEIWSRLPRKPDAAFEYLYQHLIEENDKLMAMAEKVGGGPYDEPVRLKTRPAQKVLLLVFRLDSQILNGGMTQFIWNAPLELDSAEKAIKKLKIPELAALFDRVNDRITEKMDEWLALRQKWNKKPDWEHFQKTYPLLELEWFDKTYMSKYRTKLIKALIAHVLAHKADFVHR